MKGNKETISPNVTVTLPQYEKIRKATMGETYQYFKKLIQTKSIKNLDECTDSSTELPLFDESLRLLLIDCLKLEKEVIKILLSQNENQIKGVLNCKWFFQNLPADFCTKHIFPYVSFSLRCKIINRLSRHLESTEEAEKYFAFIRDNYDNARANCILPRCSPKFILAYLEKEKPTFEYNTGMRILHNICQRFPEIGVHILSTTFDKKKGEPYHYDKYKKIMQYLAGYHPDLMVPFLKKYVSFISTEFFGRKLTKKLVTKLGQDLFPDFIQHLIFKEKILFSILNFEDQAKFIASVVRSYSEILSSRNWARSDHRLACLLKLVPQEKRQDLIDKAFKEVYKVNLIEYPKCWSSEVLVTLPTETRVLYVAKLEEFAKAGYNEFRKHVGYNCFSPDEPEHYVYMYDSRVAFEKFREILRKTPAVSKREIILYNLVKSCWINKNFEVLEEAVEYVATRHRNDDHNVIFRFMEAICDLFPGPTLNTAIFEKLDDLAYFCYLKGRKNDYVYNLWMEKQIYHRLENGLDVDSHVKRYFESAFVKHFQSTLVRDFRAKHSKMLISLLCKETVDWFKNTSTENETEEDSMSRLILTTCKEYNRLNGTNRIVLGEIPGLKEILGKRLKGTYGEVGWEEWPLEIWERYYDEVTSAYHKPRSLLYALKRRPDLIKKHLEGILKIMVSEYFREYNSFLIFLTKKVSFFGMTEKMKEIILNEFRNGKSSDNRKNALVLYSRICTIEEFSKVTERYLPKDGKLGRGSDETFNEAQMLIPTLIKNVKPRHKNLQLVLKFFLGDFLKSVLSSFYSCCYNTRCDVVIPFLTKHLEEVPPKVSYVKDIIRLILLLSDKRGRTDFHLQFWDKHKHYSIRSTVLHFVSRFFLDECTMESFRVLEEFILNCDELTIEALPELGEIPEKFLNDYVNALWRFSDAQKPNFRVNFRKTLFERFTESNINFLSKDFCESIITTHLFDSASEIPVDGFAAVYLAAKSEDVKRKAFVVLNLIKDRKPDAQSVYNFLNILIGNSVGKPAESADLFTVILENWPEYPLGVLYDQRVLFTYHNLYQKVFKRSGDGDNTFVEFGRELKKLYAGVENLNELLPIYAGALKSFLGHHETPKVILALKELVAGSLDRTTAVLAVMCMPGEAVGWYIKKRMNAPQNIVNSKKELDEFVRILEGCDDSIVQIYLRSKFEFVKTSFL